MLHRLAAFSLSEFETAKGAFEKGAALLQASGKSDATRKYKTWIRKCDAELEGTHNTTSIEDMRPRAGQ